MIPLIFAIGSAIGSGIYLLSDYLISKQISDDAASAAESASQIEHYIKLLSDQMTIDQFIDAAWPSFVVFGLILFGAFIISTPPRRRGRRL